MKKDVLELPWLKFNKVLQTLSEGEIAHLINVERKTQQRTSYLLRLQGRLNKIRSRRERLAVLDGVK